MTVGVLPQRTNLPYKTTSAFRTALWLMAGSQENGHANSFPASLLISGAKRFRDHMLISIFHLRREDIAWPAFNSQSPGGEWIPSLQDPTHNSLICISSEKPASFLKIGGSDLSSVRPITHQQQTLILLYIRAHVSVHFPTLNLSGLGGNLKPCSINFYWIWFISLQKFSQSLCNILFYSSELVSTRSLVFIFHPYLYFLAGVISGCTNKYNSTTVCAFQHKLLEFNNRAAEKKNELIMENISGLILSSVIIRWVLAGC